MTLPDLLTIAAQIAFLVWIFRRAHRPSVAPAGSPEDSAKAADDDDALLPSERVVQVQFLLALPAAATRRQVDEWVCAELGLGPAHRENPLAAHRLVAASAPMLTDSGLRRVPGEHEYRLVADGR